MNREDRENIRTRAEELQTLTTDATAAAILLHTDRLVGVLDGILRALREIEDHLKTERKETI